MSTATRVDLPWGPVERALFRRARELAGHTEVSCAEVLSRQFGASTASQANVSRWESGATKRPRCVPALHAYIDTYGQGGPQGKGAPEAPSRPAISHIQDPPVTRGADDSEFERIASRAANEPLLGPAQSELVRGMSRRLRKGPPLSQEDRQVYEMQLDILGVLSRPDSQSGCPDPS